jgi:ABC-2 type transport system ATP-binding protein
MIRVEHVSKRFGKQWVLNDLNLHVKPGAVYGLVGPNGSGKTTLIKHLMGIYRPNGGHIRIGNESVFDNTVLKESIFYISDDIFFFPMASIREMGGFYAGLYPQWNWERFDRLRTIFEIDPAQRANRLSKGTQKQVAFWLGLCTLPQLMILDEPVDGLDPVMRRQVWQLLLQEVAQRRMTMLISSHNLRELEDVCDHVGVLHQGQIILEKELADIKSDTHKLQIAFKEPAEASWFDQFQILHRQVFGGVHHLILRGDPDEIMGKAQSAQPLLADLLPLSLEEVFIYELGGMGYHVHNIIS